MSSWGRVNLGSVCQFRYGKSLPAKARSGSSFPVVGSGGVVGYHDQALLNGPGIVVGRKGSIGSVTWLDDPYWPIDTAYYIETDPALIDLRYLFHALKSLPLKSMNKSAAIPGLNRDDAYRLEITLPPLDEQRRIANLLDGADRLRKQYQEKRELANAAIHVAFSSHFSSAKHYRSFREVAKLTGGSTPSKGNPVFWDGGTIPWFSTKDLKKAVLSDSIDHLTEAAISSTSLRKNDRATVALSIRGMSLAHRLPMSVIPAGSTVNQDIKIIHSELPYSPLLWFAIFKYREPKLLSKVATSAHGTKRIETSHILDLDIPIWEGRSLSTIEGLMSQQASLMENFDHLLQYSSELYASLATRAFAGEL